MKAMISYSKGYGWHVGRLCWWPALAFAGLLSGFVSGPIQLGLQALTGIHAPYGLIVPALVGAGAVKRLRRRWEGEPFAYDPLMDADSDLDLVRRTEQPAFFNRIWYTELFMWTTIVAAFAYLPLALYIRTTPPAR
jgi:hypothetical protein